MITTIMTVMGEPFLGSGGGIEEVELSLSVVAMVLMAPVPT